MTVKQLIQKIIYSFFINKYYAIKNKKELNLIPKIDCQIENLRCKSNFSLEHFFESRQIEEAWVDSTNEIEKFDIPGWAGGVNPGDRKAIFYLISKLGPMTVLEVGTHIGASTIHMVSALNLIQQNTGNDTKLITVDIVDVNSPVRKPWIEFGTKYSPIEMTRRLANGPLVNFVTDTSLHYMAKSNQKFDLIFLDGSHSAATVYQEIPMALKLLNRDGVILLHDYFPDKKPLWSNGIVIPGPCMATERFANEGINIIVIPLKELPWPTKLESNITSLALLLQNK
ncbi:MAG: class I SAM-dependent methyltransferase [Saprospiraceae bacterium]